MGYVGRCVIAATRQDTAYPIDKAENAKRDHTEKKYKKNNDILC